MIVIDDSDLGFRGKGEHWPQAIEGAANIQTKPWIIVKMSKPVADGELWTHLVAHFSDRLIAVLTIDDLRQSRIRVSARISWEKTAEEINRELFQNPEVNGLTNAAYTIISFGPTGALIMPGRQNSKKKPTLLFDPLCMEGEGALGKGMMIGKTSLLVTGIVREIILNKDEPDFEQGVRYGIKAMRSLQTIGYVSESNSDFVTRLRFPTSKVIPPLNNDDKPLGKIELPATYMNGSSQPRPWTILRSSGLENLEKLYKDIVLYGTEKTLKVKGVPIGKFGKLETVDRQEIESLRSIQSLISEYCNLKTDRPLSIAVFGPPGSGKSFAVEEIAKVANADKIEEKTLTFNLSQFNSPDDLIDAFHQIRDVCLSGKIPLVFWDEFDSTLHNKKLGWLRFFLAPMQDGKFQQGQITHPIGKAIFVFAGGTFQNMNAFMSLLDNEEKESEQKQKTAQEKARETAIAKAIEEAKEAKAPDFHSRLKGFLDVLGPNPQKGNNDPDFIFRRAILLRSFLRKLTPHLFNDKDTVLIDPGVLRAFLKIEKYQHGARSMESIIAMSQLGNATQFNRSYLPPEKQLALHVKPTAFMALVHNQELEGKRLETLARLNHVLFCQNLRKEKYVLGEVTNETTEPKTHSSLKPYACLSEHEREQNRGAVRDIPSKLAAFGYIMVPKSNNESDFVFPPDILESMAELEHKRWMQSKFNEDWKPGAITNKDNKVHALLVEWGNKALTKDEKDKDRQIVKNIPIMLCKAGYTIVKPNN